ncbi:vitamin K epoxide reductase complex subunit 1-like [Panonychus citri]|uniref:vitamin K epoxide reductase complex subunit 1-like n=1 Tax=Panonychus citri TaxID=50023 RepID=UPI00230767A5|nr:vitamin K epoxide reductase complex subunit 1-like [Panonychus citri]
MGVKVDKVLRKKLDRNLICLSLVAFTGLFISLYALFIEIKHSNNHNYKPFCDLGQSISCTAAFISKYGKGLGLLPEDSVFNLPNPVYGIFTYTTLVMVANFSGTDRFLVNLLLIISIIINLVSIYLAYILYFILKNLCVVCVATYIVNFLLLLFSVQRKRLIRKLAAPKKE